jgi:hypothetical protein
VILARQGAAGDPTAPHRGFGFVEFYNHAAAEQVR